MVDNDIYPNCDFFEAAFRFLKDHPFATMFDSSYCSAPRGSLGWQDYQDGERMSTRFLDAAPRLRSGRIASFILVCTLFEM